MIKSIMNAAIFIATFPCLIAIAPVAAMMWVIYWAYKDEVDFPIRTLKTKSHTTQKLQSCTA